MSALPEATIALIDAAKRFAALSGRFTPHDALPREALQNPGLAAVVASALAEACDVDLDGTGRWLLRSNERRFVLTSLRESGALSAAVGQRMALGYDPETRQLLAAALGTGDFAETVVERDIADPGVDQARIAAIVTAIERAGGALMRFLAAAKSRLHSFERDERRRFVTEQLFVGRVEEMTALLDWFKQGLDQPRARAAYIGGIPGIGKSALLEETVQRIEAQEAPIVVRLDFDRAGLTILDLLRLTMEVARQVSAHISRDSAALAEARLVAGRVEQGSEQFIASDASKFPARLGHAIGEAVTTSGRPVLLILDTLEVLRGRGEQHPVALFEWIDHLVNAGVKPLHILAAGRGEALDSCPDRIGLPIALKGLDEASAAQMLAILEVPGPSRAHIQDIADGNPLVLRLAAECVRRFGGAALPDQAIDRQITAPYLYRFLLSRLDDPLLSALANPGLIARRISADFLREVLAPALNLPPLSEAEALSCFTKLAAQHWLVGPDDEPGFVRHRPDMRHVLLPILYSEQPQQCARIDLLADRWFSRREDNLSRVDALYHRLQRMRSGAKPPRIAPGIAVQFSPDMIAELPSTAQAALQRSTGRRSAQFRTSAPSGRKMDEREATHEIIGLIERQDWRECRYVVERVLQAGEIDPDGDLSTAIMTFHWRVGEWHSARQRLRVRRPAEPFDVAMMAPMLGVTLLEIWAEAGGPEIGRALRDVPLLSILGEAQQQPRSLARIGALGFRSMALEAAFHGEAYDREPDPRTYCLVHYVHGHEGSAGYQVETIARERMRQRLADGHSGDVPAGPMAVASLTPYAFFAATLALQPGNQWIEEQAHADEARLSRLPSLFGDARFNTLSDSPIAGIAGLGLFAEWAEATVFFRPHAELRSLATSAERWRRVIAGDWRYGRKPTGWLRDQWSPVDSSGFGSIQAPLVLDWSLHARVLRLSDSHDSETAATEELAGWAPDGDPARLLQMLVARYGRAIGTATLMDNSLSRAAHLRRHRVPAAFLPALVVLLDMVHLSLD